MPREELTVSLASLVRELGLAWQKLSIYQEGHPARDQAVERAHAVLTRLIAPAGSLAFGVSQDGLLGPEEKLTSEPARRLAAALYLREVAVLRIEEGVESREIGILLEALPRRGVHRDGRDLADELAERGVEHLVIEPVDFSGLVATDGLEGRPEEDDSGDSSRSLWDRIIQRLLNDERLATARTVLEEPGEGSLAKVLAVVDALMERHGIARKTAPGDGPAGQEDILGALSELIGQVVGAEAVRGSREDERATLRHVTELLAALPRALREGVLDAAIRGLSDSEERGADSGLDSLSSAVSAAEMVGSLRRLRQDRVPFSPRLVTLLDSLVEGAPPEDLTPRRAQSPEELTRELRQVFSDEDVDRAAQDGGLEDRMFLDLRHHVPIHARFADLDPYLDSLTEDRTTILLSITLSDVLRQPLVEEQVAWIVDRLQRTYRSLLANGRVATAQGMVQKAFDLEHGTEPWTREAGERCLDAYRDGETLSAVVDTLSEVREALRPSVRRLIELLGEKAIRQLLLALADEPDLSRRRRIFDLLVDLGPAATGPAVALMDDGRWYMARNVLSLLRSIGEEIDPQALLAGFRHRDPRVRIEAIKCIPELDRELPEELAERLLEDENAKVAETAAGTFGRAKVRSAKGPLVRLLLRKDPLGRQTDLRVKALRALGELGDGAALEELGHFFRSWFAVVHNDERRAAFESLALYSEDVRRPFVKKGLRAPDAKVRAICRELEGKGAAR